MTGRRRSGVALVLAGLAGLLAVAGGWPAGSAGAQTAPAPLFSFDLKAAGRGFTFWQEDQTGARSGVEGEVPEAFSSLATGPVGYGLASVAWPGPLAGNAGTLILVASPDAPDEAKNLDYPIRAEARTGQQPPASTYDDIPGTTLRSSAADDKVDAEATIQAAEGDPGAFGRTHARSGTALRDGKGVAEAFSVVRDVVLADGVVEIASVTSTAEAVTDGERGDGKASTVVSGMTIGGQPATIDENGLRIGEANQPANAVANQIAQQALSEAGVEIVMGAPTKEVEGSSALVNAGSFVITWTNTSGVIGVVLGGATASVDGAKGVDDGLLGGLDVTGTGDSAALGALGDAGPDAALGTTGAGDTISGDTSAGSTAPRAGRAGSQGEAALDADVIAQLGGRRLRPADVILGLGALALLTAGMRRLSTDALADRAAVAACPLAEGDRP